LTDSAESLNPLEYLTVGHLLRPATVLPASTLCSEVAALFSEQPAMPAIVIRGDDDSFGLVDRSAFLTRYLERYNRDVYYRHPITRMMDAEPLIVEASDSIESVGLRITTEKPEAMRSGFIICSDGDYAGVGSAITLMHAIAIAAQKANVAKSTFLANMSHEMRTPLHAVIGNLELLGETPLDAGQTDLARMASVAAHSLLDIIGDLLDLSKIEAERFEVASVEVDIRRLVNEVLAIIEPKARQKALRLVGHVGFDVPATIVSDPVRLRQVLINFAGNAVKFTATGGIFLTVRRLEDPEEILDARRVRLRFEVQDTGPGFNPQRAAALFEPFVQEDSSTTRRFGGTGLGLAISKRIVEPMGGVIGCSSVPGMGAAFWCELGLPVLAWQALSGPPDLAGHRVVLAGTPRPGLATELARSGCAVDIVTLAEDAAGKAAQGPTPSAIALSADDEAALTALESLAGSAPCLAVVTTDPSPEFRTRAYRLGASHILEGATALDELRILLGGNPAEAASTEQARGPLTIAFGPEIRPLLVIDDTVTNRALAVRQLSHFGLACDTAENGLQGLEKAQAGSFSLILVDGSMPIMDGVGFAQHFRAWETRLGRPRTPLIAISAHALVGDADRFRAAGMDDYLAKPVTLHKLGALLKRWLANGTPETPPVLMAERRSAALPFDRAALIDMLGEDDSQALADMLGIFIEDFQALLPPIAAAIEADDRPALSRAAHAGKSAAGSAAALPLTALLTRLEQEAASLDLPGLEALLVAAEREFGRFRASVAALSGP
jgi:two-component system sensor histidine kinase/response regulator